MALSQEVRPGDADWADLYTAWESNGFPAQFEIMDDDGGRQYKVLGRGSDATPTFLLHTCDGPTEWDESDLDNDGGRKTTGYYLEHSKDDGVHFRRDHRGKWSIRPGTRPRDLDDF